MEAISCPNIDQVEDEEDYVLLDLDCVRDLAHIPPNAPYVLSGLDTLNPILTIDDKLKLIGSYEETIGTCFVFSEEETAAPAVDEELGPSENNHLSGKFAMDSKKASRNEVKPIARLHKILKFELLSDTESQGATEK